MKKLKAFTLIEMLIVIVIIGILAAALIPRLSKARGRANDTARKADLSQTAAALVSYQIDKGTFPSGCGPLSTQSGLLIAGLDSIPTDPAGSDVVEKGITNTDGASAAEIDGQYGYCALEKNAQDNGGFVVMSVSETEGGANYVICDASTEAIQTNHTATSFTAIQALKCTSFSEGACSQGTDGACGYVEGAGQLRYIYLQ